MPARLLLDGPAEVMMWGPGCESAPIVRLALEPMAGGAWATIVVHGIYRQAEALRGERRAELALDDAELAATLAVLTAEEHPAEAARLATSGATEAQWTYYSMMEGGVGTVSVQLTTCENVHGPRLLAIADHVFDLVRRAGLELDDTFHPMPRVLRGYTPRQWVESFGGSDGAWAGPRAVAKLAELDARPLDFLLGVAREAVAIAHAVPLTANIARWIGERVERVLATRADEASLVSWLELRAVPGRSARADEAALLVRPAVAARAHEASERALARCVPPAADARLWSELLSELAWAGHPVADATVIALRARSPLLWDALPLAPTPLEAGAATDLAPPLGDARLTYRASVAEDALDVLAAGFNATPCVERYTLADADGVDLAAALAILYGPSASRPAAAPVATPSTASAEVARLFDWYREGGAYHRRGPAGDARVRTWQMLACLLDRPYAAADLPALEAAACALAWYALPQPPLEIGIFGCAWLAVDHAAGTASILVVSDDD